MIKKVLQKVIVLCNGKVKFSIIWVKQRKLSHYSRLKITLNILVVSYTKEFVVAEIITLLKP